MPHLLQNADIQLAIDLPTEGYAHSRFDWTGKLVDLTYKGKRLTSQEFPRGKMIPKAGLGLFNEFGMEAPMGYETAAVGDWCHKIGVGQVQKESEPYDFLKAYEVRPAEFYVEKGENSLLVRCEGNPQNGHGYVLEKRIQLREDGFEIQYDLHNTGAYPIQTEEYNHNFLCIDNQGIGSDYELKFSFDLKPEKCWEKVNPEGLLRLGRNEISFEGKIAKTFFFSNLSGGETVSAYWALENRKIGLGISETGSFQTRKVNLWGLEHVISPELFVALDISPGTSRQWTRTYRIYEP